VVHVCVYVCVCAHARGGVTDWEEGHVKLYCYLNPKSRTLKLET
jgi:hypothetical protein